MNTVKIPNFTAKVNHFLQSKICQSPNWTFAKSPSLRIAVYNTRPPAVFSACAVPPVTRVPARPVALLLEAKHGEACGKAPSLGKSLDKSSNLMGPSIANCQFTALLTDLCHNKTGCSKLRCSPWIWPFREDTFIAEANAAAPFRLSLRVPSKMLRWNWLENHRDVILGGLRQGKSLDANYRKSVDVTLLMGITIRYIRYNHGAKWCFLGPMFVGIWISTGDTFQSNLLKPILIWFSRVKPMRGGKVHCHLWPDATLVDTATT